MAIDTATRRRSVHGYTNTVVLPVSDTVISNVDRAHVVGYFSGINFIQPEKTIPVELRVQRTITKTIAAELVIEATPTKTIAAEMLVKVTTTKSLAAELVVLATGTVTKTIAVESRLNRTVTNIIESGLAVADHQGVLINDTGFVAPMTATLVSGVPAGHTLTFYSNGAFQYIPLADFQGQVQFTYEADDGTTTSQATVTITVAGKTISAELRVRQTTVTSPSIPLEFRVKRARINPVPIEMRVSRTLASPDLEIGMQVTPPAGIGSKLVDLHMRVQRPLTKTIPADLRVETTVTKTIAAELVVSLVGTVTKDIAAELLIRRQNVKDIEVGLTVASSAPVILVSRSKVEFPITHRTTVRFV
jgi:hypothetical protein